MPSIMSWHGVTAGRTSSRTMPTAGGWWLAWSAVRRSGWSLYAFVFLTNHLHLVLRPLAPTSPRACNCSSRRTPMGGLVATAIAGTSSRAATGPSWSRTRRISAAPRGHCGSAGSDRVSAPRGQTEFRVNSKLGLTPRRPRPQAPPDAPGRTFTGESNGIMGCRTPDFPTPDFPAVDRVVNKIIACRSWKSSHESNLPT